MAIILGIDPGSRVTGYGVIKEVGNKSEYIDSGCIRTAEKATLPEKLDVIFRGVSQVVDAFNPTEVAVERIFVARNAESALKLGQARGSAIVAAANRGLEIYEYEARKIKQAVVGHGGANKNQVQSMVRTLLRLPSKPQADAADALAVAICHNNTKRNLDRLGGKSGDFVRADRFRRGRYATSKQEV